MKNKAFILLLSLFLLSSAVYGRVNGEEVKRTVNRSFTVSSDAELNITNKYGNITLVKWDKPEISFSIEIIGRGEEKGVAEEMANRISIDFNATKSKVSAQTVIAPQERNYRHSSGMSINYTVNVPVNVYLDITNKYGNVFLAETQRPLKTYITYGDLDAELLLGADNDIFLKYGKVRIQQANKIDMELKYVTDGEIENVKQLVLTSAYSRLDFGKVETLELESKYDRFDIDNLGSVAMEAAYSDFRITNLEKTFKAPVFRYGKIKISHLSPAFNLVEIAASYSPIRIGVSNDHNFKVDAETSYGSIRISNLKTTMYEVDKGRNVEVLKGIIGERKDPEALISIQGRYSNITFENNGVPASRK